MISWQGLGVELAQVDVWGRVALELAVVRA